MRNILVPLLLLSLSGCSVVSYDSGEPDLIIIDSYEEPDLVITDSYEEQIW